MIRLAILLLAAVGLYALAAYVSFRMLGHPDEMSVPWGHCVA